MARFFIDRPVFSWVIAILIMLAGLLSMLTLPVSQYPAIAPPSISITATYPGASARSIEGSVTQIIEREMKGIDNLIYLSSSSESTGAATVTLTFAAGTDPDIAQMQVQNKLQLATPLLPEAVQRQGLKVAKAVRNFLMVAVFVSTDGRMSAIDLGDYVATNVEDPISRLEGVGEVTLFESEYAMRIWLDPYKLRQFELTPLDVQNAIQAENAEVTAGQLGATPAVEGQPFNATIYVQHRLRSPEAFGDILVKTDRDGGAVRLRDVARIEIGGESYSKAARYNGNPAAGMAIKLSTGANALQTAERIRAEFDALSRNFPSGMEVVIASDSTPFIALSIENVLHTLVEAVVLVFLVMYLFLQNLRATLIPTIAVPVVLLGTFGVLALFGYSINTLTLFAMVLAIGLLVDDAIVVVENVERVMHDEGLSPQEATRKSMDQITGALVGIALVLSAVFVPMAFFPGSVGVIYRQFSVTIVSAMVLSVVVAIVLSPALCATLLKPVKPSDKPRRGFFAWFNRSFDHGANTYQRGVAGILRRPLRFGLIYLLLLAGVGGLYLTTPTGFLPDEDQGRIFTLILTPPGSTREQTLDVLKQVERHFLDNEPDAVDAVVTVAGFNFAGTGQNTGLGFVRLRDWSERQTPDLWANAVAGRAMAAFSQIKEARVLAFGPPAVAEMGNAKGFDVYLKDVGANGHDALLAARNQLLGMAAQDPALKAVRPNGLEPAPILSIDIDREKARAFGLDLAGVNATLSAAWGSAYVDDFIHNGNVKKVYLQADAEHRMVPSDLEKWTLRNAQGDMVLFSAIANADWGLASPKLERYNGASAVEILGESAPGATTGQAMIAMESLAERLPLGFELDWTGLSYEERAAGQQALLLYALSLLVVFLCLAALYESWSIPFSVMLVVPLGVLGTLLAASLRGMPNDVYFQVGLLTIIGLSAKNAILIVEFAKDLVEQGKTLREATLTAARLRFRPILMTSLAFGFGVLPLALSTGAGSGSQNAIGTGVLGGMLSATLLGVFFIPLFFYVVVRVFTGRGRNAADSDKSTVPALA
ncbi:efflux RND transporter permease subunit [Rhabdochromatium marinum]|uniref:efflux RND transporter permease subunit n=1 Tax=Rhabdochromatium marinum TaxID=48729 RepID=UPI001909059F|nr:efflux RND transporter permease subunit [Rhabdochromatium marinum]MBK1649022.1 hydrophobe/amphiphile efflux-1 family RND transporter [Rhabdochromatium marinum]